MVVACRPLQGSNTAAELFLRWQFWADRVFDVQRPVCYLSGAACCDRQRRSKLSISICGQKEPGDCSEDKMW